MVSPLQTWTHREPKGLWPALGGLAVVAHVGVLGLSLPYILTLMQPSGVQSAAVVPIELIEVDMADSVDSVESSAEPESRPVSTAESTAEVPTSGATSQPMQTSPSNPVTASTPPSSADSNVLTADDQLVVAKAEDPPSAGQVEESANQDRLPVEPEATSPSELPSELPEDAQNSGSPGIEPTLPDAPTEPNESGLPEFDLPAVEPPSPAPIPEEDDTPPVVPGEDALPVPEASDEGDGTEQQAYLNIVNHEYVPEELLRDVTDTPPAPMYEAETSVTLKPRDIGCGQVDFAQRQVMYRVVVRPDGSLQSAVPWTGSIEGRSLSEEESAIACLLVSAGFSFTPATTDGEPVLNDNLILAIDIIESGLE